VECSFRSTLSDLEATSAAQQGSFNSCGLCPNKRIARTVRFLENRGCSSSDEVRIAGPRYERFQIC
jgi:hypothetical protein